MSRGFLHDTTYGPQPIATPYARPFTTVFSSGASSVRQGTPTTKSPTPAVDKTIPSKACFPSTYVAAINLGACEAAPSRSFLREQIVRPLALLSVVWRLDRLGRSLGHLIEIAGTLRDRGIFLRSLSEGFDTSTASGRLLYEPAGQTARRLRRRDGHCARSQPGRRSTEGRPILCAGSPFAENRAPRGRHWRAHG